MTYSFEKLADAPIIVFTPRIDLNFADEISASFEEGTRLLNAQPEPSFMVLDLTGVVISLGDMLAAAQTGTQGNRGPLHHPQIRENVFVTMDPMMKMAIRGLASATFGRVRFSRFDTLDEALDYCRGMAGNPWMG